MTLTTEEAAEVAGVSPATLRGWVLKGWLTPVRRGAKPLRFHYDDVARVQHERRPKAWQARHAQAVNEWIASGGGCGVQR